MMNTTYETYMNALKQVQIPAHLTTHSAKS